MKLVAGAVGIVLLVAGCERREAPAAPKAGNGAGPAAEIASADLPGTKAGPRPEEEMQAMRLVPETGMGSWVAVDFGGEGEVRWEDGVLHLGEGVELTGARWDGPLPQVPYEVSLEARKTLGNDFFCGLTVPVRGPETCVTLVVGGWGGGVIGVSSIDGFDASENETTDYRAFKQDRWYAIRMRVTETSLQAWIDEEPIVDVNTEGKKLGLRDGAIDLCAPFGIASFQTRAEIRSLRCRPVP